MRMSLMGVLAALALPLAATAQTPDQAYCSALADIYVRYVGHDENSSSRLTSRGTTDGQVAVAQCRAGNAASAIPVLERELKRAGFTLPPRG
jgi:hypothetical protein